MDIIICVNHGKMDGTNIVVNATIFNDSLNEFRFNIDNGDWVYVDRIEGTNKTQDVMFMGLSQSVSHDIVCQALYHEKWEYKCYVVVSTQTNEMNACDMLPNEYLYHAPIPNPIYVECVVGNNG